MAKDGAKMNHKQKGRARCQWKRLYSRTGFLEERPALPVLLAGNNGAFLTNFSFANC